MTLASSSCAQERTFTHRVETDIDIERQKIVDDLRFAGAIARYTLAERRDVPARVMNATEDPMTTDGRIAVIVLQPVEIAQRPGASMGWLERSPGPAVARSCDGCFASRSRALVTPGTNRVPGSYFTR